VTPIKVILSCSKHRSQGFLRWQRGFIDKINVTKTSLLVAQQAIDDHWAFAPRACAMRA